MLGITLTRLPFVRRLSDHVLVSAACSGHGVALAPLFGKILAEAVQGQLERFDLLGRLPVPGFPAACRCAIRCWWLASAITPCATSFETCRPTAEPERVRAARPRHSRSGPRACGLLQGLQAPGLIAGGLKVHGLVQRAIGTRARPVRPAAASEPGVAAGRPGRRCSAPGPAAAWAAGTWP